MKGDVIKMYPTLKATVRQGKIELLESIKLPEGVQLLVTLLNEPLPAQFTLGEELIAGLQDALNGRFIRVNTPEELNKHLDSIFNEA